MPGLRSAVLPLLGAAAALMVFGDAARAAEAAVSMARATRLQLAREVLREVDDVAGRLATHAPRQGTPETADVHAEFAAIGQLTDPAAVHARMQRLWATAAFQQLRLDLALGQARAALACILDDREIRENKDGEGVRASRREALCWALVAAQLADRALYEEAFGTLVRSGRLGHDARTRWPVLAARWARDALAIQSLIVLPHLTGSADSR